MIVKRTILITGGSGFIGGQLATQLLDLGHFVTILDKVDPPSDLSSAHYIKCDVTIQEAFTKAIHSANWDAIFHFAAIVSVPECELNPQLSFETNYQSVGTLLAAVRAKLTTSDKSSPLVFFASSAAVYGNLCKGGTRLEENSALPPPKSFYGLHKYAAEQTIRLYCKNFGLRGLSFRFFNVYGDRQKADSPYSGVISKIKKSLENGTAFTLFNNGKNERDFVHVDDIAEACMKALLVPPALLNGEPINLCTGQSITIENVFRKMSEISNRKVPAEPAPPRSGDIEFSCGNPTKAQRVLDWQARTFSGVL